jgi:putative transposase
MPSHVHLLIDPRRTPDVAKVLASIKKSSAIRVLRWVRANAPAFLPRMRDEQPDGSVAHRFWQRGGGYDRNLRSDRAIWTMIRYIHRNPVDEGFVTRPEEWRWSSASWYASRVPGPLPLRLDRLPPMP